ncbi:MAG: hypothetical protein QHH14_05820 [Clostridiales bacterium]|nr:hypothetical protein [Clostridiales bacterium]
MKASISDSVMSEFGNRVLSRRVPVRPRSAPVKRGVPYASGVAGTSAVPPSLDHSLNSQKQRCSRDGKKWFKAVWSIFLIALTLVPLVILTTQVSRYHVDVPFWDQWNFVPLLGKSFEQGVSFSDLWALHNEHRLFFPRLIMLGFSHLSRYNICWELVFSILLAVGIFIIVFFQAKKVFLLLGSPGFPWVAPILSLLAFSLHQGENWVWGWQIQIFLNVLAVVMGLVILAMPEFRWRNLAAGVACGVVATFSYANGLAYWPVAFLALLLAPSPSRRRKRTALAIWLGLTALVFVSYFYRFSPTPPSGKSPFYFAIHPLEYVRYNLGYLGASIITYPESALFLGIFCLILFGSAAWFFLQKHRQVIVAAMPFLLLGLYSISCAALTGMGRVGFGAAQATSYRYVTFSNLIWFSNVIFLGLQFGESRLSLKAPTRGRIKIVASAAVLLSLIFLVARTSYRVGHRVLESYHHRLTPVRAELLRGSDDGLLQRLYIDADYVRQGIEILRTHRLSVFRETRSCE